MKKDLFRAPNKMTRQEYFPPKSQLLPLFANIGKLITSSLELDEILHGIMEEIRVFFNPENWSLMRLDHNSGELYFVIAKGIPQEKLHDIRIHLGEGISGVVARNGKSIFIDNAPEDSRWSDRVDKITGFKTHSIISVPMVFRGTVYGVINLVNHAERGAFTEEEHIALQAIADFSAIAFAHSKTYADSVTRGTVDSLTGLYNPHKLTEIVEEAKKRPGLERRKIRFSPFCMVAYLDLNDFKEINDRNGHFAGDEALRAMAHFLRTSFRDNDQIFRIGGDEFLILIDFEREEEGRVLEKRIGEIFQTRCQIDIPSGKLGFSYGIGWGPSNRIEELISQADKGMYERKSALKGA